MLWFLKDDKNNYLYITSSKEIAVGRGECEFRFPNDQSISRKHAVIWLDNGNVKLKDVGSSYGTYINEGIDKDEIVPSETECTLNNGDKVRFGRQWNVWQLFGIQFKVVATNMTLGEKDILSANVEFLHGQFMRNWDESCSHLASQTICFNTKICCALIKGIFILTPKYWQDCVDCVKNNKPLPQEQDYVPTFGEDLSNQNIELIKPNPKRRELFEGKYFLFQHQSSRAKLQQVIEMAGGKTNLWSSCAKEPLLCDSILVVHSNFESSTDSEEYGEMKAYLSSHNRRMIPEHEIALAIWTVDCSTNCNPKYKIKNIFEKESLPKKGEVLVPETQSVNKYNEFNPPGFSTQMAPIEETEQSDITEIVSINSLESTNKKRPADTAEESVIKRRKDDLTPPETSSLRNESSSSVDLQIQESDSFDNIPPIVSKRKNVETDKSQPKRQRLEVNGYHDDVEKDTLLKKIYDPDGWISKSFTKLEIKEEMMSPNENGEMAYDEENDEKPDFNLLKLKMQVKTIQIDITGNTSHDFNTGESNTIENNFKRFKKNKIIVNPPVMVDFQKVICDGKTTRIKYPDVEVPI